MTVHKHPDGDYDCSHQASIDLCLGDGWHAGVGRNGGGTLWPWLFSPEPDDNPANWLQSWPEHELLGPLPWSFERHFRPSRLANAVSSWEAEYACGAPTQSGRPCRTGVSAPGGHCRHHRPH